MSGRSLVRRGTRWTLHWFWPFLPYHWHLPDFTGEAGYVRSSRRSPSKARWLAVLWQILAGSEYRGPPDLATNPRPRSSPRFERPIDRRQRGGTFLAWLGATEYKAPLTCALQSTRRWHRRQRQRKGWHGVHRFLGWVGATPHYQWPTDFPEYSRIDPEGCDRPGEPSKRTLGPVWAWLCKATLPGPTRTVGRACQSLARFRGRVLSGLLA
jgi:hypothetical protein